MRIDHHNLAQEKRRTLVASFRLTPLRPMRFQQHMLKNRRSLQRFPLIASLVIGGFPFGQYLRRRIPIPLTHCSDGRRFLEFCYSGIPDHPEASCVPDILRIPEVPGIPGESFGVLAVLFPEISWGFRYPWRSCK